MKTSHSLLFPAFVGGTLLSLFSLPATAATVVWGGGDGDYSLGTNWIGDNVPDTNGGDTAQINSGNSVYTAGPDLPIHAGGALEINGGSWTQTGGISWIQVAGGSISINGGTFNQGTAQNIVLSGAGTLNVSGGVFNQGSGGFMRDATSAVNISSGTANLGGNLLYDPAATGAFSLTGGTVNVADEFKPISTFNMTSGVLNANLISFADGPGNINFSGGLISVNGGGVYSGFYGGGTQFLNFTSGSAGTFFFSNYTLTDLAADGFLTNGTLRYDGNIDESQFNAYEGDGGVYVSVVPEPSAVALAGVALGSALFFRRRTRL